MHAGRTALMTIPSVSANLSAAAGSPGDATPAALAAPPDPADGHDDTAAMQRLLATIDPYGRVSADALAAFAGDCRVVAYAPAETILEANAAARLFVVLEGSVKIAGTAGPDGRDLVLGPGESFPLGALLGERAVASAYRADGAVRCLTADAGRFRSLVTAEKELREAFSARIGKMLEHSLHLFRSRSETHGHLFEGPLSRVIGRHPVSCPPETPVGTVLETMSRDRIGSVVVVDPEKHPIGIFTFHDLLDRVAIPGLPLERPVREAMSTRVWTLPVDAPMLDAVMLMAREGIRHVPLVEDGALVGLVSESRLFSVTRGGIRETRAALRSARNILEVAHAAAEMRTMVGGLLGQGMSADSLTRLFTTYNDLVVERLITIVDTDGDFDPKTMCWIVLGSEGRCEQTLATDQDNGLVIAEPIGTAQMARLVDLGRRVNEALDRCGYPLCRGNIMAGNPEWCQPLATWRERFAGWIDRGDPQALLNAAIFFDFRGIHGNADLTRDLRSWLSDYARDNTRFLLQMAINAQQNQPPLGLVRDFVVAGGGDHPNTVDLKVNGVQPIVEAARIYALSAGSTGTGTVERLRTSAPARRIPQAEVEGWIEAFNFIQRLRLSLNIEQADGARPLHNHLDPDSLNDLDRRILKESFRQVRKLQSRLARDFGAASAGFGV